VDVDVIVISSKKDVPAEELEEIAQVIRDLNLGCDVQINVTERPGYGVTWYRVAHIALSAGLFTAAGRALASEAGKRIAGAVIDWARQKFIRKQSVRPRPISVTIYGPNGEVLKSVVVKKATDDVEDRTGQAGQVGADETAFGDRSAPFITNLLANWTDASADPLHISWIRSLIEKLRPAMKPGVYVTFMSGEKQDRVSEAHQQQWARMVAVKTKYDPGNFFCLNQNIQPQLGSVRR
jgi:hypothetical protein